jgi:hypothetical protein
VGGGGCQERWGVAEKPEGGCAGNSAGAMMFLDSEIDGQVDQDSRNEDTFPQLYLSLVSLLSPAMPKHPLSPGHHTTQGTKFISVTAREQPAVVLDALRLVSFMGVSLPIDNPPTMRPPAWPRLLCSAQLCHCLVRDHRVRLPCPVKLGPFLSAQDSWAPTSTLCHHLMSSNVFCSLLLLVTVRVICNQSRRPRVHFPGHGRHAGLRRAHGGSAMRAQPVGRPAPVSSSPSV